MKNAKKRAPTRNGKPKAAGPKSKGDKKRTLGTKESPSKRVARPSAASTAASQEFQRQRLIDAATSPHTTPEERARLAQSADPAIRAAVASSGRTTLEVQRLLMHDPDVEVRRCLARYAGMDIGHQLLEDPDDVVRGFCVRYAPAGRLPALAQDPSPLIRGWVPDHEAVTLELLRRLAEDEDADVRRAVAGGRRTSWGLLGTLQRDPNEKVRRAAELGLERGARLCDCCGRDHSKEEQPGGSKDTAAASPSKRSVERRPH